MVSIQLWQVYLIYNCRHAKPQPKDKFVAIVCFDPNPCGFLVNSSVNQFIQSHPHLLPCEVPLLASQHPFLSHNSWLDCRDILSFQETELINLRGSISTPAIKDVLGAVQQCPVLRNRFKNLIK